MKYKFYQITLTPRSNHEAMFARARDTVPHEYNILFEKIIISSMLPYNCISKFRYTELIYIAPVIINL